MELLKGMENTRQATYIGSQYDPQIKLQSFFVLFKYLLLPSCTHFAFGLQRDDEMLSEGFSASISEMPTTPLVHLPSTVKTPSLHYPQL